MPDTSLRLRLGLRLTPHGRLSIESMIDAPELDPRTAARLTDAFGRGSGHGLLQLGAVEVSQVLPPVFTWWRSFAAHYVTSLCLHAGSNDGASSPPDVRAPSAAELGALALTAPMMSGSEYLAP